MSRIPGGGEIRPASPRHKIVLQREAFRLIYLKDLHMKRLILPALLAAAFSASAQAVDGIGACGKGNSTATEVCDELTNPLTVKPTTGGIPHVGDQDDLSWEYVPPTAKKFAADPAGVAKSPVRIGDENDLSWMYTPNAKPYFSNTGSGNPKQFVEFGDENNLAWLYQAPSAGKLADPARQHPSIGFGLQELPFAEARKSVRKVLTSGG